ncbi:hypothetical protein RKS58_11500 [Lysinibacillus capsici]|uniref:hypothetical protein n=1 Tax=Lysinibacillus capsici TaxID=2115968 RepID=UPI0028BD64BE|nr:hypothetical protein [Lysinibacillus capsici]WNN78437.1 hypothetical protein RKS58_11500 [Lysinibacillus capsici]
MTKRILIGLALFTYVSIFNLVFAKDSDLPQPLEEFLPEIGYKTVEIAVKEFEHHYNKELKLPLRVPPISFTHHFGRFSDLEGEMNDQLEVIMISDQLPQNHFKIKVRPVQHKMSFEKYKTDVFKLKNSSEAAYIENPRIGFHLLVFERDNWQYVFSIDRDVADQVTAEVLIDIANSIDYPKQKY